MIDWRTHICRPSRTQDDVIATRSREIVAQSFELLEQSAKPDTFLGRQTFEPFPREGDNP
ncbi:MULTISPECIES: hypothetical protein [Bradyrhizobium]|uniref:hypothetical protein n=1 Tax=Bradyrhizobium TaxID=374 RepID=UPI0003FA6084|nr:MULTISPECIES: hypothetical protein [Bradyrhizobium]RZN24004.1 hypothetical protein CWO90_29710 [Bradyrhizobium sp. Leo121]